MPPRYGSIDPWCRLPKRRGPGFNYPSRLRGVTGRWRALSYGSIAAVSLKPISLSSSRQRLAGSVWQRRSTASPPLAVKPLAVAHTPPRCLVLPASLLSSHFAQPVGQRAWNPFARFERIFSIRPHDNATRSLWELRFGLHPNDPQTIPKTLRILPAQEANPVLACLRTCCRLRLAGPPTLESAGAATRR